MINKTNIEEYFADYLDGKLSETQLKELDIFLEKNPELRQEFADLKKLFNDLPTEIQKEPTEKLDLDFYHFLNEEKGNLKKGKMVALVPSWQTIMKFAAMIAVVLGAYFFGVERSSERIVTIEKPVYITKEVEKPIYVEKAMASNNTLPITKKTSSNQSVLDEIKNIRKEVNGIQDVQKRMILAMLKQESASARLQAVNYSYDMTMADDTLLNALIRTLDYDPSINVRMAAVDAVGRFGKSNLVRNSLVNSLMKQNDPSMQMAVIDMLIELRERRAIPALASLAESSQASDFVKEKAENGIKILTM